MPPALPVVPAPAGQFELAVPGLVADAGDDAATRFIEFFTVTIRNANTRGAYGRAVGDFFAWCGRSGIGPLPAIEPVHVAAWVEDLGRRHATPTVKQHLAAVRMLFDWLVIGQAVRHNPATAVRGPRHVVRKGKTPVLGPEETRMLLDRIPDDTMAGRRDRALIGLMVYTFARIEPPRDCRRPFGLSHAAMSDCSSMA
jgi:site-specific recombinase XerD